MVAQSVVGWRDSHLTGRKCGAVVVPGDISSLSSTSTGWAVLVVVEEEEGEELLVIVVLLLVS